MLDIGEKAYFNTLKIETVFSLETLVTSYHATRRHISGDINLQSSLRGRQVSNHRLFEAVGSQPSESHSYCLNACFKACYNIRE